MTSFRDRIESRLAEIGLNAFEAARDGELERNFVNDILNGKKASVRGANLAKLAKGLRTTEAWLLKGVRSPINSYDPDVPVSMESDALSDGGAIAAAERALKRKLEPGEIVERDVRAGLGVGGYSTRTMIDGQQVDDVAATWRFPTAFLHAELRAREPDVDIIPVDGDSMIPTLLPGDRVMIHRGARAPSPDGLFAIDDGVGISVKRLQIVRPSDPLQIRIISDNAQHPTDIIMADDLKIIGRVICKVTRL